MFEDFKDIYKLRGIKGYFYGLVPYSIGYLLNNVSLFKTPDEEYENAYGKYWFYISIFLWNPVNI